MFFYGVLDVFCKSDFPPVPTNKRPPGPPGLPIDENIIALILISLVFGIYIIYNHNVKTKTPV